jgi:hypothetical protein
MSLKVRALLIWILISCAWFAGTGYVAYRWAESDLFHMRLALIEADRGRPFDPYAACIIAGFFAAFHGNTPNVATCDRFKTSESTEPPAPVSWPTLADALLRRAPLAIPFVFGLPASPFLLLWWMRRRGVISSW